MAIAPPSGGMGSPRPRRALIVGLGNDLLTDDGVGVHVVRALNHERLGPGVRTVAVGTAILDAVHLFEKADFIVAVDAMQAGGTPGTVYRLDARDVALRERASLHDFTFFSALELLRRRPEEVAVIGIEPEKIGYGLELTPRLQQAVPVAVRAVMESVGRPLGIASRGSGTFSG